MTNVDSWSPLREVWLGDCYPINFYDHLPSDVRDSFQKITEITQQDLNVIKNKLEQLGVKVRRPTYERIDDYIINGNLMKPHITPRDFYFCHNDNLYFNDTYDSGRPWKNIIETYKRNNTVNVVDKFMALQICGSNVVRVGKDVFFDLAYDDTDKKIQIDIFNKTVRPCFENFRCHTFFNGGHVDGCFAILRPGLILASQYYSDYEKTFPGWEVINLQSPEFHHFNKKEMTGNYQDKNWYAPNLEKNNSFNEHIIKFALDWVGTFTESYFDLNCLVIDEQNVLMIGENTKLFTYLNKKGINVHSVPFRTRSFWDGGLHCLTVDIDRKGEVRDYFNKVSLG